MLLEMLEKNFLANFTSLASSLRLISTVWHSSANLHFFLDFILVWQLVQIVGKDWVFGGSHQPACKFNTWFLSRNTKLKNQFGKLIKISSQNPYNNFLISPKFPHKLKFLETIYQFSGARRGKEEYPPKVKILLFRMVLSSRAE